MTQHNSRALRVAGIVGLQWWLVACGGAQTAPDTTMEEIANTTTETSSEVVVARELTPEEIEAQRVAASQGAFDRAVALYNEGTAGERNYGEIERLFLEALEGQPTLADAWFNIGMAREEQGDVTGAVAAYEQAGAVDATYARGMANIAHLRLHSGDVDGALAVINDCLARRETEPGCNVNYAVLLMDGRAPLPAGEADRGAAAIARLRLALGGEARNADAYANIARIYSDDGRLELARLVCENAILLGIDDAVLHNRLGLIALEQEDVLTAYQEFRRAIELDPSFLDAQMNVGAMALSFRDYATAAAALSYVVEQEPGNTEVRLSYGAALRGAEQYDEAEAEYNRVLQDSPGHQGAIYNLGVLAQEGRSDYAAACTRYAEYLALPGASGLEKFEDVSRRLTNLRELVMNLADFGEVDPAVVAACQG